MIPITIPRSCVSLLLAAAAFLSSVVASHAQTTVNTDPVGFITTSCLGNSDTYLSLPFTRPAEFVGSVASVSASTGTVVLSGTPGWTSNQFVYVAGVQPKTYYAVFGPNTSGTYAREGALYTVVSNSTNSVTLALNGDDISSVAVNTQVSIIPYWTLGTVFPDSDANTSYTPTTVVGLYKTKILIPNYSGSGTNLAPTKTYFYISNVTSGTGWRLTPDNVTNQADQVLLPDGYFIVRNQSGAPASSLTITGAVYTKRLGMPIFTQGSVKQDNFVSHGRPIDVALSDLGLSPALGTFTATTVVGLYKDQILLYDNTAALINKAPTKTYFYMSSVTSGTGWRLSPDTTTPHDSDTIPAGSAIIVRKASTGNGATQFWTNTPTF